ncbi:hypothetical protein M5K25_008104 [Dendrobium thyrsiflorum]|uniref:Uncharacterized protein n=1 Tax=Dendrobium thyrsiflorum TaxID=117978 RepID=A0ABD0VEP3_DENTH
MVSFGGKPPGSEGPGRNRLPTVPLDGKIIGYLSSLISAVISIYRQTIACTSSSLLSYVQVLCTAAQVQFTENFGSLPASPPLGGNFRSHSIPTT